jgi:hypothetical protein
MLRWHLAVFNAKLGAEWFAKVASYSPAAVNLRMAMANPLNDVKVDRLARELFELAMHPNRNESRRAGAYPIWLSFGFAPEPTVLPNRSYRNRGC